MDKLQALLSQLKEIDGKLDTLLAADELTPEQVAEHDGLVEARKAKVAAVSREQARLAREAERAELDRQAAEAKAAADKAARTVSTRKTDADEPAVKTGLGAQAAAVAATVAAAAMSIPATVRRVASLKNFKGTRNGLDAEHRAFRFGQFVLAKLTTDMPGRFRFRSAVEWVEKNMAAVTSNDANGYNYLIPEEFGTDLIDLREKYGVVRSLFKIVQMMSDTRVDPRRVSGLTAYFTAEGTAGTESQKVWGEVRLTAKDLMVLSRYTAQVSADAVISVGDDLAGEIAYAFALKEDQCGLIGDGSSTYGGIQGVQYKLYNTGTAGVVTQGTSNTWSAQTLADFNNVVGKLPQYADTPNVTWVCHKTYYHQVMQRLELAAGGNTALEIASGDRRPRPLFLGYPVSFAQVMPSTTATGQLPVMLGDFGLAASFGDRQQDSIAFSEHATVGGENVFERNQVAVRGTERFDINVHDCGDSTNVGPVVGLKTS